MNRRTFIKGIFGLIGSFPFVGKFQKHMIPVGIDISRCKTDLIYFCQVMIDNEFELYHAHIVKKICEKY